MSAKRATDEAKESNWVQVRTNGTGDGGGLVGVGNALAGEESSTAIGSLEYDGGLGVAGSLEGGDDGGRRGDVNGGQGEAGLLGVAEELQTGTGVDQQCDEGARETGRRTRRTL